MKYNVEYTGDAKGLSDQEQENIANKIISYYFRYHETEHGHEDRKFNVKLNVKNPCGDHCGMERVQCALYKDSNECTSHINLVYSGIYEACRCCDCNYVYEERRY